MPADLFKWEESGGLKHHCPICQTPLSHDKCRTVCLGNHVEWCHRYHTLFRKNWSSRCSACKKTDEQHEKRHRDIAEILARIEKLKADEEAIAMMLLGSPTATKSPRTPLTATALNIVEGVDEPTPGLDTPRTTKRERKKAKKATKALTRDKVVTSADILRVAEALHPQAQTVKNELGEQTFDELTEDLEIRKNLKFNKSTCNTKSARRDFKKEEMSIDPETTASETERLLDVFQVNGKAMGKEGELVSELIEAIRKDLTHHHDELQNTARNKASFWRWANKSAYRDLVENGQEWDSKEPAKKGEASVEDERRDSAVTAEADTEDEGDVPRSGSINSSEADSAGTGLTVPSSKAAAPKKPKTLTLGTPSTPAKEEVDPGWTHVGKKVLAPPIGKLKLASNGGLHHLDHKPKGKFGALAWSGAKR
ncbi:unnamed protein product [Zymoseptoria tritici ST99CH_3D7]|uniref:Zinc finger PHD-type domain-containing protein n=1 Tax=Zymoseptoria tritici (strain ST99CH_3D7) TaxID=1276538 RepID=A0A1X7S3X9_ZYMT9|nr:unnamed protein product [Zymoseptoria tritici ST99CH_3D7]